MSTEENKTMAGNEPDALTDGQLDEVSGGYDPVFGGCTPISNSRGIIGYVADWVVPTNDYKVYYWPCPNCKKPMHRGSMNWVYCDPCNKKRIGTIMNSEEFFCYTANGPASLIRLSGE